MPTHKTFKQRVRARMAHTGETYTGARAQLLRKAAGSPSDVPSVDPDDADAAADEAAIEPRQGDALPTSDDASLRATGRSYPGWFELLDAWGAADRTHPDIARWLVAEHGVGAWWSQSITVAYERARGLRAIHQMAGGFQVGATRTVAADADRALTAFTDAAARRRWLPDVALRRRPTTATHTARFDIDGGPARLVVGVTPKAGARSTVSVVVEKLPDADSAAREKAAWRERLVALRDHLDGSRA